MTPEQLSRLRPYDPDFDNPNPPAPPARMGIAPWLPFLGWLAASAVFGALVGWMLP